MPSTSKKRGANSKENQAVSEATQSSSQPSGRTAVHVGAAVVALGIAVQLGYRWNLLTFFASTSDVVSSPPGTPLNATLAKLLQCATLCDRGPTANDEAFKHELLQAIGPDHEDSYFYSNLAVVCMTRCQEGLKEPSESQGSSTPQSIDDAPQDFRDFRSQAARCGAEARQSPLPEVSGEIALKRLEKCGVVHVRSFLPEGLVQSLLRSWKVLPDLRSITDTLTLRDGREEIWVPFQEPFNNPSLLHPPNLVKLLSQYLGKKFTLDHVAILNAKPGSKAQPAHADTQVAIRHIEVHVPLKAQTSEMGPTRFCPGSHGMTLHPEAQFPSSAAKLAAVWWHLSPNKQCLDDPQVSYALPLGSVPGDATIYDSNVYHSGQANTASEDRPVMLLSFSVNVTHLQHRGYVEGKADKAGRESTVKWREVVRATEQFRSAFVKMSEHHAS